MININSYIKDLKISCTIIIHNYVIYCDEIYAYIISKCFVCKTKCKLFRFLSKLLLILFSNNQERLLYYKPASLVLYEALVLYF